MEYMWLVLFIISVIAVIYGMFMGIKNGKSIDKQLDAARKMVELAQRSKPDDWSDFLKLTKESMQNGVFDNSNKEALKLLLKLEKSPANPITRTIIEGVIK